MQGIQNPSVTQTLAPSSQELGPGRPSARPGPTPQSVPPQHSHPSQHHLKPSSSGCELPSQRGWPPPASSRLPPRDPLCPHARETPSSPCCRPLPLTGMAAMSTLAGEPRSPQVLSPLGLLSRTLTSEGQCEQRPGPRPQGHMCPASLPCALTEALLTREPGGPAPSSSFMFSEALERGIHCSRLGYVQVTGQASVWTTPCLRTALGLEGVGARPLRDTPTSH